MFKSEFMALALQQAQLAYDEGEVPIGAVIVKNGQLIASSRNCTEAKQQPHYHAEICALSEAHKALGTRYLHGCDIYSTIEPCPMCAAAISISQIDRLYYGAEDIKTGAVDNGAKMYDNAYCHHKPEIYGGIMADECAKLMQDFFKKLR